MPIGNRRLPLVLPRYSLTGDLLSFRRCPLQYRYLNGSKLPPSRPVQLWFGEFIHGVLEMSYRIWRDTTPRLSFPWPEHRADWRAEPDPTWATHDIGRIGYSVEQALRAQGKSSRDRDAREAAYRRAFRAVNDIGPHLFPLVVAAEEKIIGTRLVGGGPTQGRTDRYELHGIVDVLTSLTLGMVDRSNLIRTAIQDVTSGLNGNYEVIVDYKGARRPDLADPDRPYWQQGEWQVLTYAWLRGRQPGAIPVAAGVLLYINELSPGQDDIAAMKRALSSNNSDVLPAQGTADWYALTNWRPGLQIPALTDEFRFKRTIRVVPVDQSRVNAALSAFDSVVNEIEQCVTSELVAGTIERQWSPCGDEETCNACDCRYFCPHPAPRGPSLRPVEAPHAP